VHSKYAASLVSELSVSQRNAFRRLLGLQSGVESLRSVLGVPAEVSRHDEATGHAHAGTTLKLFPERLRPMVASDITEIL